MVEQAPLRERLLERLAALERRMHRIKGDLRHETEPLEVDFAEQAVQRENEEVLEGLDEAGHRELEAIRAALARLESGTYGTCLECGEAIAIERLRAVPTASRCVACAR
jgi:RNA polymerase-binding protein DksA